MKNKVTIKILDGLLLIISISHTAFTNRQNQLVQLLQKTFLNRPTLPDVPLPQSLKYSAQLGRFSLLYNRIFVL